MSGAKYMIVLNYAQEKITPDGILSEEHLEAMKKFWDYIQTNPEIPGIYCPTCTRTAYFLPKDFGWGFRGYEDKVWGLWIDKLSIQMGTDVDYLLHTHHLSLNIIYDDSKYYNNLQIYSKLYFSNGTVID